MQVREVMSSEPACCTRDSRLSDVARMMVQEDCGAIPVVESSDSKKIVGVVTDRDIVCRTIAKDQNPLEMTAESCMTSDVITATEEMSLEECCQKMEENQIRRILVIDRQGQCCGVVAQADVATFATEQETGETLKEVSQPSR